MSKNKYITLAPWIALALALLYIYTNSTFYRGTNHPEVSIDSTKVTKIIPEQTGSFQNTAPQPIVVVVPSASTPRQNTAETNQILNLIKSLQVTQADQQKLLDIIAKKTYAKTYENDTVQIEVKNTVENGKKTKETVNWKIKQSFVNYFEKTHTYRLKPKLVISAGIGINSRLDSLATPQLQALFGLKTKKGYELQLGYTTDKRASLSLKKDLFVRYAKPP